MIKTEKELLRPVWKEMELGGHNANIKRRKVIVKEVHKAVKFGLKDCPPEEHEEMLDAIAELFLSRIGGMKCHGDFLHSQGSKVLNRNILTTTM